MDGGGWMNKSQDAVVETTCKWSKDGNFLVSDFVMKTQGQSVLSETQRIGRDSVWQQLNCLFRNCDSDVGMG